MGTAAERVLYRVVLVVDDDEPVCRMMARLLRSAGLAALEAHDGDEAVTLLTKLGPNVVRLVVSDIKMPRMTGEQLATKMAKAWPTVPILLVSGEGGPQLGYHGSFLAKPFPPNSLIATVRALLASRSHVRGS